jgi:serine O-acetyltransferase
MEGAGLVRLWHRMVRAQRGGRLGRARAQLLRRFIHIRYGCHISAESRPLGWVNLPHPVAIVIGHGVEIGEDATIYQGVTLGQGGRGEGYPSVGAAATLYAGAVVVGPVRIGQGAIVGANAVVLADVPDGATAVGAPARVVGRDGVRR